MLCPTRTSARAAPEDGWAHFDTLAAVHGGAEDWDLYWIRLPLIPALDDADEAIAQARFQYEVATSHAAAASHIAELFASAGRTEEAVAVQRPHASANGHDLAGYLIGLGRIEEAMAVLHQDELRPSQSVAVAVAVAARSDESPF